MTSVAARKPAEDGQCGCHQEHAPAALPGVVPPAQNVTLRLRR